MEVDFMRKVDYWAGIPICFAFTVIHKIGAILGIKKSGIKKPVRNVLFIELSEMGSAILAYSSLQKVKEIFPGCNVFFLIFKENHESVHILNTIPKKNVFTINSSSFIKFAFGTLSALLRIRKAKIDTVIDMELFSRATSIISYLSGAKKRAGFYKFYNEGLYRGNFFTHRVNYNPHRHIALNFLNLVYSLKSPPDEFPMLKKHLEDKPTVPRIESSEDDKKRMFEKLKSINSNLKESDKIIVFNPNAGLLPIRAWPISNYVELARRILQESKNLFIVMMGVKRATKDANAICEVNRDRCIDLTSKTTLREVVDLFNIADVLVTNDSGPAHFASLTNIGNIVFFGPETPRMYSPLGENCISVYSDFSCSPCVSAFNHRKTSCRDNKCLQAIKVGQVLEKVKKILEG